MFVSVMQDRALEETELNKQGLQTLKDKLNTLENKVKVDMEKDKSVTEDVEKLIQQFLTVRL